MVAASRLWRRGLLACGESDKPEANPNHQLSVAAGIEAAKWWRGGTTLTSEIFDRILELVACREVVVSDHGYDELAADGILVKEVLAGATQGRVIEEYPTFHKGPCVLVLQEDKERKSIHVVWGIPKGAAGPAVLVTAYRPDASRWTSDFLRRKS
jgi:uncharacterized protein DUF4258